MKNVSILTLFRKHIQHTGEKEIIENRTVVLCNLTNEVFGTGYFQNSKVYLTTRMLKHLYDAKPAEEFDFVLKHLVVIVRYPNSIYENKDSKRGGISLVKEIGGINYFCSLESRIEELEGIVQESLCVVTCFRLRKINYLQGYKLLWSWKGDIPSS